MDTLDRRDALKVILGGMGGIAITKALPNTLPDSVTAQTAANEIGVIPVMGNFPSAGRYEIHSKPIFKVSKEGKSELIVCQGKMIIQTEDAFLNQDKRRQVNVKVLGLTAIGTSELLGGPVEISMTKDATRKHSEPSYFLGGAATDFPAEAHFAVSYEMKASSATISGLAGVMKGVIRAFPPLPSDLMAMEKIEPEGIAFARKTDVMVDPIVWAC